MDADLAQRAPLGRLTVGEQAQTMRNVQRVALALGIAACVPGTVTAQATPAEDLTLCRQGYGAFTGGRPDEALALFDQCMEKGNLQPAALSRAWRNKGLILAAKQEPRRAIEAYDKALALNPSDPWDDYVNRGNAWSALGDYERALRDYDEAFKLKPGYMHAHYNRGIVYERQGRTEAAKQEFMAAYKQGLRSRGMIDRMNAHGLETHAAERLDMNAPLPSASLYAGTIAQLADAGQGQLTCIGPGVTLAQVRETVQARIGGSLGDQLPTPTQIQAQLVALYPCPFAPERAELRPASAADLQGAWMIPSPSLRLRHPPRSTAWATYRNMPIRCEVVGYFSDGEARHAQSTEACKSGAALMGIVRKMPRVSSWAIKDGEISIARTDLESHVEAWDAYVVTQPFRFGESDFQPGDLVAYLRRSNGNDRRIATQFRHMRKMP